MALIIMTLCINATKHYKEGKKFNYILAMFLGNFKLLTIMTHGKMALSIMTLIIMKLSIMTLIITTLRITDLSVTYYKG